MYKKSFLISWTCLYFNFLVGYFEILHQGYRAQFTHCKKSFSYTVFVLFFRTNISILLNQDMFTWETYPMADVFLVLGININFFQ